MCNFEPSAVLRAVESTQLCRIAPSRPDPQHRHSIRTGHPPPHISPGRMPGHHVLGITTLHPRALMPVQPSARHPRAHQPPVTNADSVCDAVRPPDDQRLYSCLWLPPSRRGITLQGWERTEIVMAVRDRWARLETSPALSPLRTHCYSATSRPPPPSQSPPQQPAARAPSAPTAAPSPFQETGSPPLNVPVDVQEHLAGLALTQRLCSDLAPGTHTLPTPPAATPVSPRRKRGRDAREHPREGAAEAEQSPKRGRHGAGCGA